MLKAIPAMFCAVAMLAVVPAHGAENPAKYPSRAIRFIVPFPPGGGNDTLARMIGQQMAVSLGQQILIDNRPGAGGSSHLAVELFGMMTATKMLHVPYKGLSPALTDLLAGEVQVMFSSAVAMLPQVKAGRLRAIAMTGDRRSAAIPDIPTVAEAGVKGYATGSWYGVVAPAGTPGYAIDRLSAEIIRITKSPQVTNKLVGEAVIPVGSTPAEFTAHIKSEIARWGRVIKAAKIKLE